MRRVYRIISIKVQTRGDVLRIVEAQIFHENYISGFEKYERMQGPTFGVAPRSLHPREFKVGNAFARERNGKEGEGEKTRKSECRRK